MQSRFVQIDGLRLHIAEHGGASSEARPVLLLHGGMAHSGWWDPLASQLGGHVRSFALDRRGHGWSDWAEPKGYGWEIDLRDTEQVASELDSRPWLVVGHSQGGMLAIHLALRARFPIAGMVVLDAPLHPGEKSLRRAGESFRRMPQIRYPSLEQAVRRFQPYPSTHHIPAAVLQRIAEQSFKPSGDGGYVSRFHWKRFQADASAPSPLAGFTEDVGQVPVPTLVVRGGQSTILSAADHAAFVARLPAGRGAVVPETTHSLHVEKPDEVAGAILDFAATL